MTMSFPPWNLQSSLLTTNNSQDADAFADQTLTTESTRSLSARSYDEAASESRPLRELRETMQGLAQQRVRQLEDAYTTDDANENDANEKNSDGSHVAYALEPSFV